RQQRWLIGSWRSRDRRGSEKVTPSQQLPVLPKKRMRSVEIPDRDLVGHHAAEPLARKPAVKMKRRRLDLERGVAQLRQIEIDGVIGRRADRGRDTGKHRQGGAMDVTGGDPLYA